MTRSNKALLAGVTVGLALTYSPEAIAQANVNLNTWTEVTQTSANWNVAGDGLSVNQTVNGAPTIFLSPNNFINTTVEGRFGVQTSSDDDFMGFVFGLTSPTTPGSTIDALLLDWKQGVQSGADAGLRLSYVTGDIVNSGSTNNPYWTHNTTSNTTFQSLGEFTGPNASGRGWADNTDYDFQLEYSSTDIVIHIEGGSGIYQNGLEVFNVNINDPDAQAAFPGGAFPDGRFGFYNFSQAQVRYEGFTQTDDPVLATTPTDGGTLDFGNVRVSDTATESIEVVNAGGPGSTLTGTVPTPADPAFSLDTAPDTFSLGEGDDTTFDYTFAPTARGVVSEAVNISSNDPADGDGHDFTLTGTGVGPVFDAANTLGFNDADANDTTSLILNLSNITTDGDLGTLTDLTLNDITIDGLDAALFSLIGFTPGTTVAAGGDYLLQVAFTGDGTLGPKEAFILIETDEGTLLAGDGNDYQVDLTANAVPEPASLTLLALAGFAMARRRRG